MGRCKTSNFSIFTFISDCARSCSSFVYYMRFKWKSLQNHDVALQNSITHSIKENPLQKVVLVMVPKLGTGAQKTLVHARSRMFFEMNLGAPRTRKIRQAKFQIRERI